jgi:hypothetical protein
MTSSDWDRVAMPNTMTTSACSTSNVATLKATRPALPPVKYIEMHRADQTQSLSADVARLAARARDFSANLLDSATEIL